LQKVQLCDAGGFCLTVQTPKLGNSGYGSSNCCFQFCPAPNDDDA